MDEAIQLADTIHVVTSRPAAIKKTYTVDWPRPRMSGDRPKSFLKLKREIKNSLMEEFNQSSQRNTNEIPIENFIINKL